MLFLNPQVGRLPRDIRFRAGAHALRPAANLFVEQEAAHLWLHDRFVGTRQPDEAAYARLMQPFDRIVHRDVRLRGDEDPGIWLLLQELGDRLRDKPGLAGPRRSM